MKRLAKRKYYWINQPKIRRIMQLAKLWFFIDKDFKEEFNKAITNHLLTGNFI